MASSACFLHHHALTTPARSSAQRQVPNFRPSQLVCRAQKQEVHEDCGNAVSRRLALTVLIGAAAIGSKVSPADAAYGEAGMARVARAFHPTLENARAVGPALIYHLRTESVLDHGVPHEKRA